MNTPEPCRVLVVDDDAAVREAYRTLFARHPHLVLAGEARDGVEGVEAYERLQPDLVLMDLQMPRLSGIDAIRQICGRWRRACVVAMTTFGTREYVVAALRAGAMGYLLKDASERELLSAIEHALAGDMPLSSAVRRELVATVVTDPPESPPVEVALTPREVELTSWLAHGLTNQQIARRMHLSEGSVKQYLSRISHKLGAVSRTQVLVRAIQLGIVDPGRLRPPGG